MSIRVALNHKTSHRYAKDVWLSPQVVRLRPAPHCRTPILSYSLSVAPEGHFVNWQQDPYSNYLARLVFPRKTRDFAVEVDLVAEMTVVNPFDFFMEKYAEEYPFTYEPILTHELTPYLAVEPVGPKLAEFLAEVRHEKLRTVQFLVDLNAKLHKLIKYVIRLEPGIQAPEQTLSCLSGSCRDSAWLLVQALRQCGLAARFASGYLIQLVPDVKPLDGPGGASQDFCDLHAWAEVYLPGAGWIGLDATSGLLTGEGHIPLACAADPTSAAAITGFFSYDQQDVIWAGSADGAPPPGLESDGNDEFSFAMSVTRIHETPRVTKPYSQEQWIQIEALGHRVDDDLAKGDVRLTMGGEPTFVSMDDLDAAEWNTDALGPRKYAQADQLIRRLRDRFAPGGFLHHGQGKWYPGESLPRWSLGLYWRKDGKPIWLEPRLVADETAPNKPTEHDAHVFITHLAGRLGAGAKYIQRGYEDVWYYLWKERRLPVNVDPFDSKLTSPEDRARLAKVFEQGLDKVIGFCLPLRRKYNRDGTAAWISGPWFFRSERMYLVPGDSPMGFRLPLDSIAWVSAEDFPHVYQRDPWDIRGPLPERDALSSQLHVTGAREGATRSGTWSRNCRPRIRKNRPPRHWQASRWRNWSLAPSRAALRTALRGRGDGLGGARPPGSDGPGSGLGDGSSAELGDDDYESRRRRSAFPPAFGESAADLVRTALCAEVRNGVLRIFVPPVRYIEDYLDLVAAIEETAAELKLPVLVEGYTPPHDPRINDLKVTPDPGVIEVNTQPAASWEELVRNTTALYEEARQCRLTTEKFMLDGRHVGTGGGNHIVFGGATPADSPLLRRPNLLRSMLAYWNNHPSLSYVFSGMFVGPTSQAPRVDDARNDQVLELETAFKQVPDGGRFPAWLVDRIFRNLLVDVTGNTHRAEFCIDKLYAPESATGRLGLLEMRGFEMPPHSRMSLTQHLLLRALIARFWDKPYNHPLVRWGTETHDRFMLPHFSRQDLEEVVWDLHEAGFPFKLEWLVPHLEFRFPLLGSIEQRGIVMELRQAIEPWHVLGETPGISSTVRYVDSSLERIEVMVKGMVDLRHRVLCNGVAVPLHPTGTNGQFVAGVRYRAWQPASCLHPTIGVHAPLVFDVYDTWSGRSIGGCRYHVSHPGGRSYDVFPINAYEAEGRRIGRFFKFGHTPGPGRIIESLPSKEFPFTLDLRQYPS